MHPLGAPSILAQVGDHAATWKLTLLWIGVAIACLAVGGTILAILRKKMLEADNSTSASSLMEHLRDAHRRGEITDAEYDQARRSMASRVSHVLDTKRADGLFELPDPKRRLTRPPSSALPTIGQPKPAADAGSSGAPLQAPPGYDLTGEPLPKPKDAE